MHRGTTIKRGHKSEDCILIYSAQQDYRNIDCLQALSRFAAKNNSQKIVIIYNSYHIEIYLEI